MPRQPTAEIRLRNVIECLERLVPFLNELNFAFGTPFLIAISNTILSLITAVQTAKKRKDECIQFMEHIHQVVYAVINLHTKSEIPGRLELATLDHLKRFTECLLSQESPTYH
ncbi:hypothetical protein DFH08DRAFT_948115 [Mycena albidolilacea]|uniref:Uncharacterized protein n=1 Tax=Mycena albidolilacea TaxID=1033008 RepID=A0AAD7AQD1_9AGAR|nr:hypothetical protein DFH08DRAFT_948115 [Mycena albidolilacea]